MVKAARRASALQSTGQSATTSGRHPHATASACAGQHGLDVDTQHIEKQPSQEEATGDAASIQLLAPPSLARVRKTRRDAQSSPRSQQSRSK